MLVKYPALRDPAAKGVLQAKLYAMSRLCFLLLYRFLLRKLNKDAVNVVLLYAFGNTSRAVARPDGDEAPMKIGENLLSEEELDAFLRYELI